MRSYIADWLLRRDWTTTCLPSTLGLSGQQPVELPDEACFDMSESFVRDVLGGW